VENKLPTDKSEQTFLLEYIKDFDAEAAAKKAGITNKSKINSLVKKYQNQYKALFVRMGMPEEEVLQELIALIRNPEKAQYNSGAKEFEFFTDNGIKLQALKLYLELTGALSKDVNVNISESDENRKERETIYTIIEGNPDLQEQLLKAVEQASDKGRTIQ